MGSAVLVVDVQLLVHEVLRAVVRAALPGAAICCERDLAAALRRAQAAKRLDLVLLDLALPGCQGIEALARFRESHGRVPVAVVSANADGATVRAALRAGAAGYMPKTLAPKVMVAALRLVAAGGVYVPPEALEGIPPDAEARADGLTHRQVEILRLLIRGMPNREIGHRLGIAESTVKQHTHAVYQVLGVANRTEAAVAAARWRIAAG